MKTRKEKGQYGYRNYHIKVQIAEGGLGAFMIIAQLVARHFIEEQAWKNILTVMAILSVLPTANVASPLLASIRYRTPEQAFYQRMTGYEDRLTILYDLIITTKEAIYPIDALVVHPSGIYAYCPSQKLDLSKAEAVIGEELDRHKLNPCIKIIRDEKTFLHRLSSLNPDAAWEYDKAMVHTVQILKSMSM